MMFDWRVIVCAGLLAASACSGDDGGSEQIPPSYCNPLAADPCMLPWPSSFYLAADDTSATGFRVAYPPEALPQNNKGASLDGSRYNLADGFSIGSQPLVYFGTGVSAKGLPGQGDLAASLDKSALIWLLTFDDAERVPLFAELDANAEGNDVPALVIRPQVPLRSNTRYVVVLRAGLEDAAGRSLAPPDGFRRLRDGVPSANPELTEQRARTEEILAMLEREGLARSEIVLAWDFHTSSTERTTGQLQAMVEQALASLPATGPTFTIDKTTDIGDAADPFPTRVLDATIEVPSFLASEEAFAPLQLDGQGKPELRGPQKFPFHVVIPPCAWEATAPVPILLFGHGLFAVPRDELTSDVLRELSKHVCAVQVASNWWGLSAPDLGSILTHVIPDFSGFFRITDQLSQAHVNHQVLIKLLKGALADHAALQDDGRPLVDGKELYYLGISNGAIQGVALAALTTDIERFVLHVGGGWWSMMLRRSSNFAAFEAPMRVVYRDPVDRMLLMGLSQSLWDAVDPISWASHVIGAPLAGRSAKRVISQESKDDDQVNNLGTRAVARALGLPALDPMVEPVFGLTAKAGPLDSAYVQWDIGPPVKPPGTNVPAPRPKDAESAHKVVRVLPSFHEQLRQFFRPDGQVVHSCDGPCGRE